MVTVVDGYLLNRPKYLEPLPQVGARRAFNDLAHVDNAALLHLARLLLAALASLLLATLALAIKAPK